MFTTVSDVGQQTLWPLHGKEFVLMFGAGWGFLSECTGTEYAQCVHIMVMFSQLPNHYPLFCPL